MPSYSLDIASLSQAYADKTLTPRQVLADIRAAMAETDAADSVWISLLDDAQLEHYLLDIEACQPGDKPLWGIPFAIKDNIDLAGIPTTAACAEFAYTPDEHAQVVQRLVRAGALPIGKTNLDQFATGLVGTRSPYGAVPNSFNPHYISGGSSSGSAYAVANHWVSFALGTDTAGSGRVPAAFNNIIGVKPTRGLLSTRGLVPACRSLDVISLFCLTPGDAQVLTQVTAAFDAEDPYSRPATFSKGAATPQFRFGVPKHSQREFFGHFSYEPLFEQAIERMSQCGGEAVEIDFAPFIAAARLLYEGAWVAERTCAIHHLLDNNPGALLPVTRDIIAAGQFLKATQAFNGQYQLAALKRQADQVLAEVDCVLTPTAPAHYTIDQVNADPINLNSRLGYYTNFMNLLDYAALAIPAGFTGDGLPFGITLFGPAFHDAQLVQIAAPFLAHTQATMGTSPHPMPTSLEDTANGYIPVAVCGAHLQGMPLNWQLQDRHALLQQATTTTPHYRFYALAGGPPFRPGLIRVAEGGAAIDVEVWAVPEEHFGSFVAGIPAPLGIGKLELADGRWVSGFICEPYGIEGAEDITHLGGWRPYINGRA